MKTESIPVQLENALRSPDTQQRLLSIKRLRDSHPEETIRAIFTLLDSNDQKLRRLAAGSLSFFRDFLAPHAAFLADRLLHHSDQRVRLSCAIHLMWIRSPVVDAAFLHALHDSFDRVVQIACVETGARDGPHASGTLHNVLSHPSWRVRLEACKALITLKAVDAETLSTLEAMSHDPEALVYDTECAELDKDSSVLRALVPAIGETKPEFWGKLEAITAKAREVASLTAKT